MHLISRREQRLDILFEEEIGRAVRTIEHADRPFACQWRGLPSGFHAGLRCAGEPQHVTSTQRARSVASELAEPERGARTEHDRSRKTTGDGEIGTLPRPFDLADAQRLTCLHHDRCIMRHRRTVQRHRHPRAGQRHGDIGEELERRAGHRQFQRRRLIRVAHKPVGMAERIVVHRTRRRDADMPKAEPTGQFLKARLRARRDDLDHIRHEGEVLERRRRDIAAGEKIGGGNGLQIIEIGLDARNRRAVERLLQGGNGRIAIVRRNDHLGKHRVVERRDFGSGLDPAIDANAFGKHDFRQKPGARTETGMGHFGIDARLDRRALRGQRLLAGQHILARRLPDHPFDEIDAEHGFCYRMFDLKPRIDLEKIEFLALRIVDEFHRAGRGIVRLPAQRHGGGMQALAHSIG